jgi:intein/homing endonuclease
LGLLLSPSPPTFADLDFAPKSRLNVTEDLYDLAMSHPALFIDHFCLINDPNTPERGPFRFRLWPWQWELLDQFVNHKRVVVLKARQMGVSWLMAAYALWTFLSKPGSNIIFISKREEDAAKLLAKAVFIYRNLPPRFKFEANKRDSDTRLAFRSEQLNSTMSALAAVKGAGRSETATLVIPDEWAFQEYAEEMYGGYEPTVGIYGEIKGCSTANGPQGLFYSIYQSAKLGKNGFHPAFLSWSLRPGRTQEWRDSKAEEFRLAGTPELAAQEYPCIAAGERVGTIDGILPIEKVIPKGRIFRAVCNGEKPLVEVVTKLGYRVRCTPDHRLFDGKGWVEAQDAQRVILRPPTFSESYCTVSLSDLPGIDRSVTINELWGLFLGLFMGDGSISGATLSMVSDARDLGGREMWSLLCQTLFGAEPQERVVGSKGGGIEQRFNSNAVARLLDDLGCTKEIERGDKEGMTRRRFVTVPDCIWRSPKSVVLEFLRGLFEADGFNSNVGHRVLFFTQYERFARDVQLLLLGFGVTCKLQKEHKKATDGHLYTGYTLTFSGERAALFNREIGFISSRKIDRTPTREGWKTFNEFSDEVVSVTPCGTGVVYDLTTSDRTFDANGIVVHNCDDIEAFSASRNMFFPIELQRQLLASLRDPLEIRWAEGSPHQIGWRIYQRPATYHKYTLGADVALGVAGGNYSTISVIDRGTGLLVATARMHIAPDLFASKIYEIGMYYNEALVAVERNNHGLTTLTALEFQLRYRNLYRPPSRTLKPGTNAPLIPAGWNTTKVSRPEMLFTLKTALSDGSLTSLDLWLSQEVQYFEQSGMPPGPVEYQSLPGYNDDIIFSTGIAWAVRSSTGAGRRGSRSMGPLSR